MKKNSFLISVSSSTINSIIEIACKKGKIVPKDVSMVTCSFIPSMKNEVIVSIEYHESID